MKVDFNAVRKRQIEAYTELVQLLRDATDEDGFVSLSRQELEEVMYKLRNTVVIIALSYLPGDDDVVAVLGDRVLPDYKGPADETA